MLRQQQVTKQSQERVYNLADTFQVSPAAVSTQPTFSLLYQRLEHLGQQVVIDLLKIHNSLPHKIMDSEPLQDNKYGITKPPLAGDDIITKPL